MRVPLSPVLLLLAFFSAAPGFSQSTVTSAVTTPGDGRVAEWMYGEHIPAVPGLPFTAKVELELVNQLQDGTLLTAIPKDERVTRRATGSIHRWERNPG